MKKIIFSGMLVLACCLFGEIGVVHGVTDIVGQCVPMSLLAGDRIALNRVCMGAGYGNCNDTLGNVTTFATGDCTGGVIELGVTNGCHKAGGYVGTVVDINVPLVVAGDRGSVLLVIGGGWRFKCDARSWGFVPQPDNVPGDFNQSIKNTTDWILGFVGMIAVLMLIWGGINYLTSAGDEDKARTGKKTITYALIGMVVAGIAYAIVDVIITVIL